MSDETQTNDEKFCRRLEETLEPRVDKIYGTDNNLGPFTKRLISLAMMIVFRNNTKFY